MVCGFPVAWRDKDNVTKLIHLYQQLCRMRWRCCWADKATILDKSVETLRPSSVFYSNCFHVAINPPTPTLNGGEERRGEERRGEERELAEHMKSFEFQYQQILSKHGLQLVSLVSISVSRTEPISWRSLSSGRCISLILVLPYH